MTAVSVPAFSDEAEIVVIGAGPAGASTAATLAEYGHDVLVVDKNPFPRDKPCGDGLTRGAVAFLRRHGLGDLVAASQPIEGGRAVFSHGREELKFYRGERGACVPRLKLDAALLDAAVGLGARSVTARVTRPLMGTSGVAAVEVQQAGHEGKITGKYFVAADGPNSIIRQRLGVPKPHGALSAYAVRQYFEVECTLDPLFDVYFPLVYQGMALVGYGWVFPVNEHRANIGVGYYRSPDSAANPPIRALLVDFVEDLRRNQARRFGEITPVGRQFGSPLGVTFAPEICELDNVMFVGDAGRMTDPVSGEGIAIAFAAGEELASHLHCLISRKATALKVVDKQPQLGRRFSRISPRLAQNITMPVSVARKTLAESPENVRNLLDGGENSLWTSQPFLWSIREFLVSGNGAKTITCPAELSGNSQLAAALGELDRRAEDELQTTFPFLYERVHRRLHGDDGPMLAVAALCSVLACGGKPGKRELDLALGCELFDMFPDLAGKVVDRPARTRDSLNNAFAVIAGDFVFSQAFKLVSPIGAARVARLAECAATVCEGAMSESDVRLRGAVDLDRPLAAAQMRTATLYSLACRLGGELGGADDATADALAAYGRAVGMALRIAADLRLCLGDNPDSDHELVVETSNVAILIAFAQSPAQLAAVSSAVKEGDRLGLSLILGACGLAEAAVELCRTYASEAKDALPALVEPGGSSLRGLAEFALRKCGQAAGEAPRCAGTGHALRHRAVLSAVIQR